MKIRPLGVDVFHADRRTDGQMNGPTVMTRLIKNSSKIWLHHPLNSHENFDPRNSKLQYKRVEELQVVGPPFFKKGMTFFNKDTCIQQAQCLR